MLYALRAGEEQCSEQRVVGEEWTPSLSPPPRTVSPLRSHLRRDFFRRKTQRVPPKFVPAEICQQIVVHSLKIPPVQVHHFAGGHSPPQTVGLYFGISSSTLYHPVGVLVQFLQKFTQSCQEDLQRGNFQTNLPGHFRESFCHSNRSVLLFFCLNFQF